MTYFFIFMACVAFISFGVHSRRANGYRMAYAAALFAIYVVAALWWSGRFG